MYVVTVCVWIVWLDSKYVKVLKTPSSVLGLMGWTGVAFLSAEREEEMCRLRWGFICIVVFCLNRLKSERVNPHKTS